MIELKNISKTFKVAQRIAGFSEAVKAAKRSLGKVVVQGG